MGKSKRRILGGVLPRLSSKDLVKTVSLLALWTLAGLLYWRTLEGGDVDFLKSQAGYFALLLLASMGVIAGAVRATAYFYPHTLLLRVMNWVLGGILLSYMLTRDMGTTLENHGQYNFMFYMLMWQPVALSFVMSKVCGALRRLFPNDRV